MKGGVVYCALAMFASFIKRPQRPSVHRERIATSTKTLAGAVRQGGVARKVIYKDKRDAKEGKEGKEKQNQTDRS